MDTDDILTSAGADIFVNGFQIVTVNPNVSNNFDIYITNQSERIDPCKAIKYRSDLELILDISIEHTDRLAEPYNNCKKEVTALNQNVPYFQHNCSLQVSSNSSKMQQDCRV